MEGYYLLVLIIAAGLGFIPASIAKKKGYSFGLWWLYGWLLFIVAIIHVSLIPDKNASQMYQMQNMQNAAYNPAINQATNTAQNSAPNVAEELRQYKELLDAGVITEEEFKTKKAQLLDLL